MAGLGRKQWSSGDVLTAADMNGYIMDQAVMVFAGTAARASAIPTPSAGMVAYSTATGLQVYNGSAWTDVSTGYGSASGTAASSTAITDGGLSYTLLTFTTDSNLVVGKAGLFDALVIGGGGSGGGGGYGCGGGGAGNYVQATVYLAAGTYAVTIGAGGAGNGGAGNAGGLTKLAASPKLWAYGGQPGKEQNYAALDGDGGASGTPDSYAGGQGVVASYGESGGGGGGSTGVGGNGVASSVGGTGGAGYTSTFTGSSVARAGGGGGGGARDTNGGPGTAGGGNGAKSGTGSNATANTGGGGGGGGSGGNGGNGAAGVVFVRFRS